MSTINSIIPSVAVGMRHITCYDNSEIGSTYQTIFTIVKVYSPTKIKVENASSYTNHIVSWQSLKAGFVKGYWGNKNFALYGDFA